MHLNQILGIILLVAAGALLYFGYVSSQSIGEQVHESFTGRFTDSTTWYFVFGIGAAVGSVFLLAFKGRS